MSSPSDPHSITAIASRKLAARDPGKTAATVRELYQIEQELTAKINNLEARIESMGGRMYPPC